MLGRRPSLEDRGKRPSISSLQSPKSAQQEVKDYSGNFKGKFVNQWGLGLKIKIFFDKWLGTSSGKLYDASLDALADEQAGRLEKEFGLTTGSILSKVDRTKVAKQVFTEKERFEVLQALNPVMEKSDSSKNKDKYYFELAQNYKLQSGSKETNEHVAEYFIKALSINSHHRDAQEGLIQIILAEGISEELEIQLKTLTPEILNSLAHQLQKKEKYESAFKLYKIALKQDANNIDALTSVGYCYLKGYSVDQSNEHAAECFVQILSIDPSHKDAQEGLIQVILAEGISEDLERQLKTLNPEILNSLGCGLRKKRSYENASKLFFAAAEKASPNSDILANIGYCYLKGYGVGQSNEQAAEYFIKALSIMPSQFSITPSNVFVQDELVQIILDGGISKNLENQFKKTLTPERLNNLGCELRKKKSYENASKLFFAAAEKSSTNPDILANAGHCYLKGYGVSQSNEHAAEYFIQSLSINPSHKDAQEGLVQIILNIKDISGELENQIKTLTSEALNSLGCELRRKKSYENASKLFFAAEEKEPQNPGILVNVGDCYLNGYGVKQSNEEAAKYFIKAFSINPNHEYAQEKDLIQIILKEGISRELAKQLETLTPETLDSLAYQLHLKQAYESAFKLYETLLKKSPNNVHVLTQVGYYYLNGYGVKQSNEDASRHFVKALSISPDLEYVQKGLIQIILEEGVSEWLKSQLKVLKPETLNSLGCNIKLI